MSVTLILSALWLGILTAISPCPLATNIAAVSFIGRNAGQKNHVILSGLLYSTGRTIAYAVLGAAITAGMLRSAEVSRFLQKYMNEALGPILILMGLVLLGWVFSGASLQIGAEKLQQKAEKGGLLVALPIGFLFALSFCPVSAGLFFGGLLPLALDHNSPALLPVVFGVGTSLPVVLFAFLMAFSSTWVSKVFNQLTKIEVRIRQLTGTTFIVAGIYYCLAHIYGFFG